MSIIWTFVSFLKTLLLCETREAMISEIVSFLSEKLTEMRQELDEVTLETRQSSYYNGQHSVTNAIRNLYPYGGSILIPLKEYEEGKLSKPARVVLGVDSWDYSDEHYEYDPLSASAVTYLRMIAVIPTAVTEILDNARQNYKINMIKDVRMRMNYLGLREAKELIEEITVPGGKMTVAVDADDLINWLDKNAKLPY